MDKLVIDCTTGEVSAQPLSADEVQWQQEQAQAEAQRETERAAREAQQAADLTQVTTDPTFPLASRQAFARLMGGEIPAG